MGIILVKGRVEVKQGHEPAVGNPVWLVLAFLLLVSGCALTPPPASGRSPQSAVMGGRLYIGTQAQRWEEVVRANPLGPDDNIKGIPLSPPPADQPAVSHFIVQIRRRENPHIHQDHDATIVMLRGHGRLVIGSRIVSLRAGDTIFVPRGTPHYYVNESAEPTVALAIFSPSYDGKDAIVVPFSDRPPGAP